MAKGRIRLLSTIPGPRNLEPLVREFCARPGVLTAFSDSAVRSLALLAPEEADIETLVFGGLARRFATLCGELPHPVAQLGHAVAAVGVACEDLPSGSPFQRTSHRLGLHRAIAETLHEMSEYGLSPEVYEDLANRAEPNLANKFRSLAHLERSATETLKTLGRSFGREHYRLCEGSAPEKGTQLGRLFVLAGGEFSPQAADLLKWAVKHGADVTVVVYRHPASARLFSGARLTSEYLGLTPEETGKANEILTHLFADSKSVAPDIRCSITSAADPLAEAEWAIRGCLERHEEGQSFESMALYVRDSASYAPLIESAAKRLGVPLRMWRRAPLLTNSFARLTQAALQFCASRDVRTLMPLARTTYVGLGHEQRKELQSALRAAYSDRANQWDMLRHWASERFEEYPWLVRLLDWRDEAIATPAVLEAWIARLRDLMMNLPFAEGTHGGRERDKRAVYVLQQSLSMIASVRRLQGPRSLSLAEVSRYAGMVWQEADVSVPSGELGVLVTAHAEAIPDVGTVFVLGMLEGIFPRRRTEDPILSDFDREALSTLRGGVQLPTSRDRAEAERDEFYALCAAPRNELVLSYPETDEERDNVPAFYLDEVDRALGGVIRVPRPRKNLTPAIGECLAASDREIATALEEPRQETAPLRFVSPFTARAFALPPETGFNPRELRDVLQCPFSYFMRRRMEIAPERLRSRWFSLVSLPQKARIGEAPSELAATHALTEALDAHLDAMVADVPDWEIALIRSGGRRLIREWVEREFLARKIWPKEQVHAGAQFGQGGLRDVLPKITKLTGGVTATSRTGPYSVVHLTETSGPAKGYGGGHELTDQDKLYYGLHLLAAWERAAALEIETMAGERLLMLLPRLPGVELTARVADGLKVIDLGAEDGSGPRSFFNEVKELAREAVTRIEEVEVRAIRGDHCAWCDYGELCRQSMEFGEEDSPFVEDL